MSGKIFITISPASREPMYKQITDQVKDAIAAGADGILMEVHPDPSHALCDGAQSLKTESFSDVMRDLRAVATAVNRGIA